MLERSQCEGLVHIIVHIGSISQSNRGGGSQHLMYEKAPSLVAEYAWKGEVEVYLQIKLHDESFSD